MARDLGMPVEFRMRERAIRLHERDYSACRGDIDEGLYETPDSPRRYDLAMVCRLCNFGVSFEVTGKLAAEAGML